MTAQESSLSTDQTHNTDGQDAPDFTTAAARAIDGLHYGHSRDDMVRLIADLMDEAWDRGFTAGQGDILLIESERANDLLATVLHAAVTR